MDFTAFHLRVGTVAAADADGDALRLSIDLGGITRPASAHITERYGPDDLVGRQVIVVANPPGAEGGEVVVLAAVSPTQGAVLLAPDAPVPDGTAVV